MTILTETIYLAISNCTSPENAVQNTQYQVVSSKQIVTAAKGVGVPTEGFTTDQGPQMTMTMTTKAAIKVIVVTRFRALVAKLLKF